jgi:hypothetical protein
MAESSTTHQNTSKEATSRIVCPEFVEINRRIITLLGFNEKDVKLDFKDENTITGYFVSNDTYTDFLTYDTDVPSEDIKKVASKNFQIEINPYKCTVKYIIIDGSNIAIRENKMGLFHDELLKLRSEYRAYIYD